MMTQGGDNGVNAGIGIPDSLYACSSHTHECTDLFHTGQERTHTEIVVAGVCVIKTGKGHVGAHGTQLLP